MRGMVLDDASESAELFSTDSHIVVGEDCQEWAMFPRGRTIEKVDGSDDQCSWSVLPG